MFVLYGHFDRIGYMSALFAGPLSVIGSLSLLLLSHCRPIQRNCMHDYWHMRRTDVPDLGLLFGPKASGQLRPGMDLLLTLALRTSQAPARTVLIILALRTS